MPGKSKSKPSKPTMAKAKKMLSKQSKSKASRNQDTQFVQFKVNGNFTPVQGVLVSNYVYSHVPLLDYLNTTSYGLNNIAEFQLWRAQYDKFRVNSVTWKVKPKANVADITTQQADGSYNLSGDGIVHEVVDRDGAAPSNVAQLARYPSYRKHSILKPWTRTYSVNYPTGLWLDCQTPYDNDMRGIFKANGLSGGLTMYAENIVEDNAEILNEPWASVEILFNCVFQGKTSASLSFSDVGGGMYAVTITPNELYVNLAQTPATNIRGTMGDTITLDEETEEPISDRPDATDP